MFIYGKRCQEAETIKGAVVVMVSVTGEPDGPDTAQSLTDHGDHDYPCSTAMVRLPDTPSNRADLLKAGGYWGWTLGEELVSGRGLWEWHGIQFGEPADETTPILR